MAAPAAEANDRLRAAAVLGIGYRTHLKATMFEVLSEPATRCLAQEFVT